MNQGAIASALNRTGLKTPSGLEYTGKRVWGTLQTHRERQKTNYISITKLSLTTRWKPLVTVA